MRNVYCAACLAWMPIVFAFSSVTMFPTPAHHQLSFGLRVCSPAKRACHDSESFKHRARSVFMHHEIPSSMLRVKWHYPDCGGGFGAVYFAQTTDGDEVCCFLAVASPAVNRFLTISTVLLFKSRRIRRYVCCVPVICIVNGMLTPSPWWVDCDAM